MKGNAPILSAVVCVLMALPHWADAQIDLITRGASEDQQAAQPVAAPLESSDLLEFLDGSFMHGGLKRMDTGSGLVWDNPAAVHPFDLKPDHINLIHFAKAASVATTPTSELRFVNGDDLLGSVTSMDDDHLVFRTWFGGPLTIARAAVQTVTFLSSNYTILYEGPDSPEGWIVGSHNPDSWTFRDGTFVSASPGSLGRDFGLTGSSTIEFDLAWTDAFELLVNIYSDAVDHLEYGNSYMLEFKHDQAGDEVNLRHIDIDRQIPLRNFGTAPLPGKYPGNKVRITIQSNKNEGTVAVFADNILVKRWKDENGFTPSGGGVLFQQIALPSTQVKLSNFKVSQWQGRYEPETTVVLTNMDVVRFINHDQAAGKITGIDAGKLALSVGDTVLQVPIQRVTQINFAGAPSAAPTHGPWEVRPGFRAAAT